MLRILLIPMAIGAALPAQAADGVSSYAVERGAPERVKDASGAADAMAVEVVFGMRRADSRGFVAAAGGSEGGVTVSRGPGSPVCTGADVRLP